MTLDLTAGSTPIAICKIGTVTCRAVYAGTVRVWPDTIPVSPMGMNKDASAQTLPQNSWTTVDGMVVRSGYAATVLVNTVDAATNDSIKANGYDPPTININIQISWTQATSNDRGVRLLRNGVVVPDSTFIRTDNHSACGGTVPNVPVLPNDLFRIEGWVEPGFIFGTPSTVAAGANTYCYWNVP